MGQVRALAGRLGTLEHIDVLVNNAGLMADQRRVTADGFDEVFAVNHLAPFLLTNLLLGKLTAAAPARVITVTSDAHTAARLDLDDPQLERGWESWRAYANSKLANIVYLATSPDVASETGGYCARRQRREPSAAARDYPTARRLWRLSEELTGLTPARPAAT